MVYYWRVLAEFFISLLLYCCFYDKQNV